ncbi:MAG: hypothetical protein HQ546_05330 [Planctomycetes bacterium]|nr:hypothetical protein [Planctomycetota bacterium]
MVVLAFSAAWLTFTPAVLAQFQQPTPMAEDVGAKPSPAYPEPRSQAMRVVDVVAYAASITELTYHSLPGPTKAG